MIDKWFRTIRLNITPKQFQQLPRNGAYKYEYFNDKALLTPRPHTVHAVLDMRSFAPPFQTKPHEELAVRPLVDADWPELPPVFAAAFDRVQPFASLDEDQAVEAARDCLQYTRSGGDGPLLPAASFVAASQTDGAIGAGLLITLVPPARHENFMAWSWRGAPPAEIGPHNTRAHLTWIFVSPRHAHSGVGSALLQSAVRALSARGYQELTSTILIGNDSSLLWHWRMGFELVASPWSRRGDRYEV